MDVPRGCSIVLINKNPFPKILSFIFCIVLTDIFIFPIRWLNDPQFVGSFETEEHVYFLFRESAVEYINCGKVIRSTITLI